MLQIAYCEMTLIFEFQKMLYRFVNMLKRVDKNQKGIIQNLKQYDGISVFDTHAIGKGFADIVVGYSGKNFLFEIKNLSNGKTRLTPSESNFHNIWEGQINIVFNHFDILKIIGYSK